MPDNDYEFPTFRTVDEVRDAISATGDTYFGENEMRRFRTRVGAHLYGGRFFVTSERAGGDHPRQYTVRMVFRYTDTGKLDQTSIGGQGRFASSSGAHGAARTYSDQTDKAYLNGLMTGNL